MTPSTWRPTSGCGSTREEHIRAGQQLRDAGKLQDALAEFRHAAEIDASNFAALQEIRRTADLMQKQAA
jgi:hypothetical protein